MGIKITKKEIEYLQKYLKNKSVEDAVSEIESGRPIQYVVGNVEFYNSIINVDERVLIPRFETELLVEKVINYCNKLFPFKIDVLDMCTGSGCIAISVKKEIDCDMDALDISSDALSVARDNAKNNDVFINYIESDLFNNVNKKYDVIISNPPYISYDEEIMDVVKNNEPNIALYALNDGLYFYDKILANSKNFLKDKFLIAFEIGYLQGEQIEKLVYQYFDSVDVVREKDYSGKERYLFVIKR